MLSVTERRIHGTRKVMDWNHKMSCSGFYTGIEIPWHRQRLDLKNAVYQGQTIEKIPDHIVCYRLLFDEQNHLRCLEEYYNRQCLYQYFYSHKGNLSQIIDWTVNHQHSKVKTRLDYSHGLPTVLEKRFYIQDNILSKKECFTHQRLSKIQYIKDGMPYCEESFNTDGQLVDVTYLNHAGLKI